MNQYFYKIKIDRVIDGDTLEAIFDLGFNLKYKVRVRMMGYDAPETWRPSSQLELENGTKVKTFLETTLLKYPQSLYCKSTNIDLYGRSSGIIYFKETTDYVSINDMVIDYMTVNNLNKQIK